MINNVKQAILKYHVSITPFDSDPSYRCEAIVNIFWHSKRNRYYFWYENGEGKQRNLSCHTKDRKEAKRFALAKMEEILTAEATDRGATTDLSLSEFATKYLDQVRQEFKESTIKTVRSSFNQFVKFIGDVPLVTIRHSDCYRFVYQNTHTVHWSRTMYGHLKSAFNFGIRMEWCMNNPFARVPKPKITTDEEAEWVSPNEFSLLESSMPDETHSQRTLKRLCVLAFETGARMGELRAVLTEECHLPRASSAGFLDVVCSHRHRTKGNKRRIVPLSGKASEVILDQINDNNKELISRAKSSAYLFPNLDTLGQMSESTLSHFFKRIARQVFPDREGLHFHSLRHSLCTNLMRNGAPPLQVQQIAGHSDLRTTMIYSHMRNMDFTASLDVMNALNK